MAYENQGDRDSAEAIKGRNTLHDRCMLTRPSGTSGAGSGDSLMTIPDGYTDLPPGKIASVVTFLEMRQRPQTKTTDAPLGLAIRKVSKPNLDWYRKLYRAVGQDWLWFSRLRMSDEELAGILQDTRVSLFTLSEDREDKGLLELDGRVGSELEIAYFGITRDLLGRGAGRYLMEHALSAAWDRSPKRVWVHTCTLDHPRALAFYMKAGFTPYKRAVEIADDPRLTGEAPRTAAPHVPIIGTQ
jgi:GNAT superfamily N-acetyltransferase